MGEVRESRECGQQGSQAGLGLAAKAAKGGLGCGDSHGGSLREGVRGLGPSPLPFLLGRQEAGWSAQLEPLLLNLSRPRAGQPLCGVTSDLHRWLTLKRAEQSSQAQAGRGGALHAAELGLNQGPLREAALGSLEAPPPGVLVWDPRPPCTPSPPEESEAPSSLWPSSQIGRTQHVLL